MVDIQIKTISGYDEIGANCTAVKVDDEVVLLDLGLNVGVYSMLTEDENVIDMSIELLIKEGAIPNINLLGDWIDKVKLIIPSHGHLDHIGAIAHIANKLNAPILTTPMASEIIKIILHDERIKLNKPVHSMNTGAKYRLSDNITIEFVNVTHSIPDAAMPVIHTPDGQIAYGNDYKLDTSPVIGRRTNIARLRQIGDEGKVLCFISECLYAHQEGKMPSETVARYMVKDVLEGLDCKGTLIVTTFASHIARLKSIIEFGRKTNREIIMIGRSLNKYTLAAHRAGIFTVPSDIKIIKSSSKAIPTLKKITKNRAGYLLITTGHQGEPRSVLTRMVNDDLGYEFSDKDMVIFSCKTIPAPVNIANRAALEKRLKDKKVRFFKDIHVSGHAAKEDIREIISALRPKNIIPSHGDIEKKANLFKLASEMGYTKSNIHLMNDGDLLNL